MNKRVIPFILVPVGSIIAGVSMIYFKHFYPAFGLLLFILGLVTLVVNILIVLYMKYVQQKRNLRFIQYEMQYSLGFFFGIFGGLTTYIGLELLKISPY